MNSLKRINSWYEQQITHEANKIDNRKSVNRRVKTGKWKLKEVMENGEKRIVEWSKRIGINNLSNYIRNDCTDIWF